MLTFVDRFNIIKVLAVDQIRLWLRRCENCEYAIRGKLYQYNKESDVLHALTYIREERGIVYVLGEPVQGEEEEYDYQIDELDYINIGYIADELGKI